MKLTERPATTSMISVIHTLKPKAGLADDETYRDFLEREAGVRSAKELSVAHATRVIEKMRELAGGAGAAKGAVVGLDGPIGTKLRALWISGYNLGVVRDRADRAMLSFLERQTGVSHVRFLKDSRAGSSAIEGLKSWLAREAGVQWPAGEDANAARRAVVEAQWRRLDEFGALKKIYRDAMTGLEAYAARLTWRQTWADMEPHHFDEVQKALGSKLRAALAAHAGDGQ